MMSEPPERTRETGRPEARELGSEGRNERTTRGQRGARDQRERASEGTGGKRNNKKQRLIYKRKVLDMHNLNPFYF